MTRLARRNRTRRIKLWKRRGFVYRSGRFWKKFTWNTLVVSSVFARDDYEPY